MASCSLRDGQVLEQSLLVNRTRDRNRQVGDGEHARHLLLDAAIEGRDLDVIGADDKRRVHGEENDIQEGTELEAPQLRRLELARSLGTDVLNAFGLEELVHDDERHVVLLRDPLEQFKERNLRDVTLDEHLVVLDLVLEIDLRLRRVVAEVRVQVSLATQRGEFPPHGGRREVDRRLVGVGDVRLLGLHHREQETVFTDADEFLPLAKLRGLLADDVAGDRGVGDPLSLGDPFLDHQLRFLVGEFEPGLLHQLAELVDAILGVAPLRVAGFRTR